MSLRIVVTDTDAGIGKTVFAAGLAHHLGASYWKPVQAGFAGESDSEAEMRLGGLGAERILPQAWRLNTLASPHQAAGIDGVTIDAAGLAVPQPTGPLVIEGAGGLMVPLSRYLAYLDVLTRWQLPVILCAHTGPGAGVGPLAPGLRRCAMRHWHRPLPRPSLGQIFPGGPADYHENRASARLVTALTIPWKATAISVTSASAAKLRSMRILPLAWIITAPRPSEPPTHSPITAPMGA